MSAFRRTPVATYRLQLNADFPFEAALAQLDYLVELGISDLYLSPIMQARAGSGHGYDVTDPTMINPALGGEPGLRRLSAACRERGIGILLDIVPNHMAATPENPSWDRMLKDGPDAPEAPIFDVFWDETGKVRLPILGDHYANVLERDEITVERSNGDDRIVYYEHRLPISDGVESRQALQQVLEADSDDARRDALDRLIACQHYRPSYWRTGSRSLNYRRSFDTNDLAAVRAEDDAAFELLHRALFKLIEEGTVSGLRVDHIDGLRDPAGYLDRLQRAVHREGDPPFYILVEKILSGDEELPAGWPVAGTTGYDFLNMTSGALSSSAGLPDLIAMTGRFAAEVADFEDLLYRAKHQVIEELFTAEIGRLTRQLEAIARNDRYGRDLIREELDAAIREVTVCLPVYRTYVSSVAVRPEDRRLIENAVTDANERRPDLAVAFSFLRRILLLEDVGTSNDAGRAERLDIVAAWQQFSGPVMAKGLEDTTLYRDPTLLSANAVGGERELAGVSVSDFHAWAERRAASWPLAMNATSTHDSKRSEDVRARIAVLSEIPDEWESVFEQLRDASAADVRSVDDQPAPDGRAAMMLFQTMLGSWPLDSSDMLDYPGRVQSYAIKAEREAKLRTSWIDQSAVYEDALRGFIDDLFENERFLEVFKPFQERIALHGMLNSLSATLIKMTAPGIPDFYQGSEIWDFSLVDPDNRRPVDYALRRSLLDQIDNGLTARELLEDWQSGAIKLQLIQRTLRIRAERRGLFERGRYLPLDVDGPHANNLIAFARVHDDDWAIAVASRLTARMARESGKKLRQIPLGREFWSDTRIILPDGAPGDWSQPLLSNRIQVDRSTIDAGDALQHLPFALLLTG
ncbi:hypothetical protein BH23CHL2_BH23CHL2_35840 [soil metagenome]